MNAEAPTPPLDPRPSALDAAGDNQQPSASTPPTLVARHAIDSVAAQRQSPGAVVLWADPDFVDHVFAYLLGEFPELAGPRFARAKRAVRAHFAGTEAYVRRKDTDDNLAQQVLSLFNGRNATEVARSLGIGRTTVYRYLKQAGRRDV